jgi:2-iminobutanoate/2-iminopropanoate deaminase
MEDEMVRHRQVIQSKPGGFTHGGFIADAVSAGGFIFFSAIRGNDPATGKMSDDPRLQARQVFLNLEHLLTSADATLDHVVKATLYLQELGYGEAFNEVWQEYFPEDPPARIAVRVADANTPKGGNACFALDVIAVAP